MSSLLPSNGLCTRVRSTASCNEETRVFKVADSEGGRGVL